MSDKRERKRRKPKRVYYIRRVLLFLLAIAILFGSYSIIRSIIGNGDPKVGQVDENPATEKPTDEEPTIKDSEKEPVVEPEPEPEPDRIENINVVAVGDILYHITLVNYGRDVAAEGYDFNDHYSLIKDFLSEPDLTVGNFESASNEERPISTYPMFNIPKQVFSALKTNGFDGLATANNHSLDAYFDGIGTTIDYINEQGIVNFGTQKDPKDRVKILEAKDIKVAFIGYTDLLNGLDGLLDTQEKKDSINTYYTNDDIIRDVASAKDMGADFIIAYPHWGNEYQTYPTDHQKTMARGMIGLGVDVVIGNHPHVVQPTEFYEAENGNKGYIAYSLGNFISNQRVETMDDYRTEHGLAVEMQIQKNFTTGDVELVEVKEHPLWVRRIRSDYGGFLHQTLVAEEYMEGGSKASELKDAEVKRATRAYETTKKTVDLELE